MGGKGLAGDIASRHFGVSTPAVDRCVCELGDGGDPAERIKGAVKRGPYPMTVEGGNVNTKRYAKNGSCVQPDDAERGNRRFSSHGDIANFDRGGSRLRAYGARRLF